MNKMLKKQLFTQIQFENAFKCLAVIGWLFFLPYIFPSFIVKREWDHNLSSIPLPKKCSSFNSLTFDYNNVSGRELFKTFSTGIGNPEPLYSIPIEKFYLCYLHLGNAFAFILLRSYLMSKVEKSHNMIWRLFFHFRSLWVLLLGNWIKFNWHRSLMLFLFLSCSIFYMD